ncbi:PepSY domain-containing protein [Streptomyces endophyticus]|uniref:PepSY domain-containing protein n=1 Tax=Streptomyces endophyticus TaxID=714166 RepID=A0ABU6FGN6_9ACTN|nr:PepSY domain-containing protein [Streptomyces endophyticus]MEB8341952.1 PepSY domain-containing protein [Streptomyces endophyticus]
MHSVPAKRSNRSARGRAVGVVCAVAASLSLLSACSSDDGDDTSSGAKESESAAQQDQASDATPTGRLNEDQAERKKLLSATKVDWDKAARTAEKDVSGSKLLEIELGDDKQGNPEWDAEVVASDGTSTDVTVDAVTGKVTGSTADKDQDADDKKENADKLSAAKITAVKAADTATERKKGKVTSVALDDSDSGSTVWSVDVVTPATWDKTTFDIDAANGKVLNEHVDQD